MGRNQKKIQPLYGAQNDQATLQIPKMSEFFQASGFFLNAQNAWAQMKNFFKLK
jgi:hypothetical protein